MSADHDHDTYEGPLELVAGDEVVTVAAVLSGVLQPIDGAYHWQGRLAPTDELTAFATLVGRKPIGIRVPGSEEVGGRLGERNPWGGYRVSGTGAPPAAHL
ncbi:MULTISPECIES: DUF4873 domain-containing protein [Mumia]|uniref:DUF4873 domain-containing protein n=1 Tax=Mumia xiangluensis TaxID=1678900 RepID=A0ABW1QNG6_9ACTN|nr:MULTISPECIES: DUF4873 domain-containing protein [Mumia]